MHEKIEKIRVWAIDHIYLGVAVVLFAIAASKLKLPLTAGN